MAAFSFIRLRMKTGHTLVPMRLRVPADEHPLTPVITRLRKDPILRTEENPIFFFRLRIGSVEHRNTVRVHPIPPIGESREKTGRSLNSVRGTALSADGSAGILRRIPAELYGHTEADHY